jgi:hypothetical protein
MSFTRTSNPPRAAVRADQRGEIFVEYLIVLGIFVLTIAPGLIALAPKIVKNYTQTRTHLLSIQP